MHLLTYPAGELHANRRPGETNFVFRDHFFEAVQWLGSQVSLNTGQGGPAGANTRGVEKHFFVVRAFLHIPHSCRKSDRGETKGCRKAGLHALLVWIWLAALGLHCRHCMALSITYQRDSQYS